MTSIRPPSPPAISPAHSGQGQGSVDREAGKLAAQRAFFAALGKAQAPQAPTAPAAAPAPAPQPVSAKAADPPQKILRPGSLVDIRV